MNKGGLEHLLTARLTALGALIQRKPKKLRKLVDILRLHANQPCAMPEPLLESLLAIAANFEKNQNKGTDMEAALIEVIHA
jgi:hypothetical protein